LERGKVIRESRSETTVRFKLITRICVLAPGEKRELMRGALMNKREEEKESAREGLACEQIAKKP